MHRQAVATLVAASTALDRSNAPVPAEAVEVLARLRSAAAALAPGWLGLPLDQRPTDKPREMPHNLAFVRIGRAQPDLDGGFPVVVPLVGAGHLTLDTDARDPRVAGLLRALLLRLLAAAPPGAVLVRAIDHTGPTPVFAPYAPLVDAGLMPPPATDLAGARAVLTEAERWLQRHQPHQSGKVLLVVVAGLHHLEAGDMARVAALAQHGPEHGLHLIVAGWPPPPSGGPHLPRSTRITLDAASAYVSAPPGGFGTPALDSGLPHPPTPIVLDPDPPTWLVAEVCHDLRARSSRAGATKLVGLLTDDQGQFWTADSAAGLHVSIGHDGERVVTLPFNDATPHWLVGGRPASGKTSLLTIVSYGLATRYSPDELALYLVSFAADRASLAEFAPSPHDHSTLPQIRALGLAADREYGVAVLRELAAELTRRAKAAEAAAATNFADLRARHRLPRIVCVMDECQVLLDGDDPVATDAAELLGRLTRDGRSYGIHLLLASRTTNGAPEWLTKRGLGQFPVRVALPGGDGVLEPNNDAAAGLPLGRAVVNTAGGLGGPRGATRGHERIVCFPNPHVEGPTLSAVRRRLWEARGPNTPPPPVFAGDAPYDLASDPTYQAALAGQASRPAALLGRAIDVSLATAAFPFDTSSGAHLAILGPGSAAAEVLDVAARGVAAHHAPGTARFVIASLVPACDGLVGALATEIGRRHEVTMVNQVHLTQAFDQASSPDRAIPSYLVVFGMDAGEWPPQRLARLLRVGPGRGQHLLSWWREPRRFAEKLGHTAQHVAGLVFVDAPTTEVAQLLGQPIDWRARHQRGLLYDQRTGARTVFVPFTRSERAS